MIDYKVSHHILLCATPTKAACCLPEVGIASWERLKILLQEFKLEKNDRAQGIVLRSKVDCLRCCKEGPIMLIWPDGIWYGSVTPERIDSIVIEHILKGRPINEWIIKRTPQGRIFPGN